MTTTIKTRGPGRIAADGATGLSNVSFALADEQRAWVRRNGGSLKVRELINAAMAAAPKEKRATKARP